MRLTAIYQALPVAAATALLLTSGAAHAESKASATGKGITGGALLGAEAVMLTEAAFSVRPAWAYVVGGGIGAVGGGVGGYFVEDSSAKASILLLAGGMVLAIPTAVAVLSVTAYEPPADYTADRPPSDEPVAEPPQPTSALPAAAPRSAHSRLHRTQRAKAGAKGAAEALSLFDVGDGLASVTIPDLQVRDLYTREEVSQFGVQQGTEVRLSFVNVLF